ncbi:uncharacterized protein RCC_04765 [Ramularia collo-cygni]|uniref:FYVE-type domain-containing protein n=1 Tax=Ramularia collo-cygni TaxID=112498 RepID=A0A2D3V0B2_9PEZI|nr:uncharacterized protein RCC_04765 [Ramularia collo-cygni]CZT18920.1 uncharacterized protein RCC_04765 [Ramularia collo-cygni]
MATTSFATQANAPTNYYKLPQAGPSPPETYSLHSKHAYKTSHVEQLGSQTPSPTTNISPTSISPISNSSNHKPRQLRQPRQPLYTPAALRPAEKLARPTDIPGRPRAPDTPPASTESSFTMHTDSPHAMEFATDFFQQQGDYHDVDAMSRGLSRASSHVIDEELGDVTSAPTTAHWKPDESAVGCYICSQSFTWFFRRHHCRRCGNLVCDNHIRHTVPLDQNARYHPNGHPSKACKACWDGWKIVKKLHHSRASSIAESSNSSQGTAMPIPNAPNKRVDNLRIGSMARSEGGMVWSTF